MLTLVVIPTVTVFIIHHDLYSCFSIEDPTLFEPVSTLNVMFYMLIKNLLNFTTPL